MGIFKKMLRINFVSGRKVLFQTQSQAAVHYTSNLISKAQISATLCLSL
jgi:hypothetical protein